MRLFASERAVTMAFRQVGELYIKLYSGVYLSSARTAQIVVGLACRLQTCFDTWSQIVTNRPALLVGSNDFIYQAYPFVPRFESH
jgi:hypothetical protein